MKGDVFVLSDGSRVQSANKFGPEDWYTGLDTNELAEVVAMGDEIAAREQDVRWAQGRA
jgi:hypothetical protein